MHVVKEKSEHVYIIHILMRETLLTNSVIDERLF